jgi:hypothetical protein
VQENRRVDNPVIFINIAGVHPPPCVHRGSLPPCSLWPGLTQVVLLRGTTLAGAVRGGLRSVLFAGWAMGAIKQWLHQIQIEAAAEPSWPQPEAGGGGLAVVEAASAAAVDGAALACPVDPVEAWLGQPIRWLV